MEGRAQLFLTVSVGSGGIIIIDAGVIGHVQKLHGALLIDALDGQGAEGIFSDHQAGAPQFFHLHRPSLLFCCPGLRPGFFWGI